MPTRDVTKQVTAARSGGPAALTELAKALPDAHLHLPLETLNGVRNRPETALELGERLPVHWMQLSESAWALPCFTTLALCRQCADGLSWCTDGRAIRTLGLPGVTALSFFEQLFVSPEVDRVILNPMTDAELHLARTDVESIVQVKERASLWFYTRGGQLKRPVALGKSSFVSSFLTRAGGAIRRLTDATFDDNGGRGRADPLEEMLETAEILGTLHSGPLASLCAEIYQLLLRDPVETMELVIAKSERGISVDADPPPGERLLGAIGRAARKHLAEHDGDIEARFHVAGSTIVVSSSRASSDVPRDRAPAAGPSPPPLPTKGRRRKAFDYIPLEPEPENTRDDEPG